MHAPFNIETEGFRAYLEDLIKHEPQNAEEREYAHQLGVHAYGDTPDEILDRARPRESQEIKDYRIASYEPKTMAKFDECVSVLQTMFNEGLYQITWPEPASTNIREDTLESYCTEEYDVLGYWEDEGLKRMLANPNGLFTIDPGLTEDPNEWRAPTIAFYEEDKILAYKKDKYAVIHLSGNLRNDGMLLVMDTKVWYWLAAEYTQGKTHFRMVDMWQHGMDELGAWAAGGVLFKNSYKSYFNGALPFWNKAISHDSDLDGVYVTQAYPHMWLMDMDCPSCSGQGEMYDSNTDKVSQCGRCEGTGKITTKGPYEYYSVKQDALAGGQVVTPPLGFENPDPSIIKALDEKVDKLLIQGMEALKMHVVSGLNQSGKAKEWDRKELHQNIRRVSDRIFKVHLVNSIHYINLYRYWDITQGKVEEQEPDITAPQFFDVLGASELTEEVKNAQGTSPHYIAALMDETVDKRFSARSEKSTILSQIIKLDPFPGTTYDDKMAMLADQTASREDVKISCNIKGLVMEAMETDEEFVEKPYMERMEILRKMVTEEEPESIPVPEGGELGGLDAGVVTEETSKLLSTVGGIEGVLKIQQSVRDGATSREAAIATIKTFYKLDDAQANQLLGAVQPGSNGGAQENN